MNAVGSSLRDYASTMLDFHRRVGDEHGALAWKLLVEHGQDAVWSPLPDGEEYGFAKQCYRNAATRVLLADLYGGEQNLTYYEGVVARRWRMPHAWAQDADGRVYELTLRHNDSDCPYCHGAGSLHPADHWDYDLDGDDDDFYDDEEITCEMCGGTGKWEPESREGSVYLGVPIPTDVLRDAVNENGVFGVLFQDPARVHCAILQVGVSGQAGG